MMQVGTELFAIVAVCAYAHGRQTKDTTDRDASQLADLFCRQARGRIAEHFRAAARSETRRGRAVAKKVLTGQLRWLEDGIVQPGHGQ